MRSALSIALTHIRSVIEIIEKSVEFVSLFGLRRKFYELFYGNDPAKCGLENRQNRYLGSILYP